MSNWTKALATASIVAALGGCAGTPATPPVGKEAATPSNCVRYTGTRIPLPEGQCVVYAGRVYSGEEIQATGASSVADALRLLGAR